MFNSRSRNYACDSRLTVKIKEYTAHSDLIPLKENWSERWYNLPYAFDNIFTDFLNFETRDDDVFVVTFMKCGTTWMQETAWLLLNNLDFERAKSIGLPERSPYLDWSGIFPHLPNSIKGVGDAPSPRLIKTHMPANLLPQQIWTKKLKVIYVARNIKDAVVSSYHFVKGLGAWDGDMDKYVEDFINNEIIFTPYWERTLDFWKMRNEPNIFFTTYEDMKHDLGAVIQKLCKFLDRPQLSQDELQKTIDHLSFDKMKNNKSANVTRAFVNAMPSGMNINKDFEFMRRGIVGSYKDELTPENQKKINDWSDKILAKHGIKQEEIFDQL